MFKIKYAILFIVTQLFVLQVVSQDRIIELDRKLEKFAEVNDALNNPVDISVSNSSLSEFLRGIAIANSVNIDVDPKINKFITNNFSNAKVKSVFLYVCKRYNLDIDIIDNIITFKNYVVPIIPEIIKEKEIGIKYNATNDFISFDLQRDSLDQVVKKITVLTDKNVIISPKLENKIVSVFIKNRPFGDALDKLCLANDLTVNETKDGFYYVEPIQKKAKTNTTNNPRNGGNNQVNEDLTGLNIVFQDDDLVSIDAYQISTQTLIEQVSKTMGKNYFIYETPQNKSTMSMDAVNYEEFLTLILSGTEHTFRKQGDVYLLGNRNDENLRQTKLIELQNRRVENVLASVPAKLKLGIEITEFVELNGLVVSGSAVNIRELEEFINIIDVLVPVVTIEIIIADVNDTKTLSTGIQAGLNADGAPESTSGVVSPGVDVDLSTDVINDVIGGVNGTGLVNLGMVVPEFYLRIKALEEAGDIDIKSTPTVATLNGHETVMTIGDEQYYLEVNNQIVNNQISPNVFQSQQWKAVNADLTITVTPFVSKDGQVTLAIKVVQSTFTSKVAETAPPGQTQRSFESLIRVKNGEMILLGGLNEDSKVETSSGLPFLSRIPVIKWLFSSRTKTKTKKQLTILIRPVVSYQ